MWGTERRAGWGGWPERREVGRSNSPESRFLFPSFFLFLKYFLHCCRVPPRDLEIKFDRMCFQGVKFSGRWKHLGREGGGGGGG